MKRRYSDMTTSLDNLQIIQTATHFREGLRKPPKAIRVGSQNVRASLTADDTWIYNFQLIYM